MCQGLQKTDASPPSPTYTIEALFKLSPLWVDFFTDGGEWVEAFVLVVSGRAAAVRYRENEAKIVSEGDLHRVKPFHTAVRQENDRKRGFIRRVLEGDSVTFYDFENVFFLKNLIFNFLAENIIF